MNRRILLFLTLVSFFILTQCSTDTSRKVVSEDVAIESEDEEKEDVEAKLNALGFEHYLKK